MPISIKDFLSKIPTSFSEELLCDCDSKGIVSLDKDEFASLLEKGRLSQKSFTVDSDPSDIPREGLNLAINIDTESLWYSSQQEEMVESWLKNCLVTTFCSQDGLLKLVSDKTLFNLLLAKIRQIDQSDLKKLSAPRGPCEPTLKQYALEELSNIADYSGMVDICDYSAGAISCLDQLCRSDYAWVKDSICCVYISTSGGNINQIWLFPFTTTL